MRNLLAFVGAAVLTFLGIGWYLGWYDIKHEDSSPGHSRLSVDINKDKINKDVKQGADKIKDAIDKNSTDSQPSSEKKTASSEPTPFTPPSSSAPDKRKDLAKETFKELVSDGWFAPPAKK